MPAYDLAATILFSLEGATLGVAAGLDLLGVLVVGFATALGGGVIRDLLLGDTPPAALRFKRYICAALIGGLIVFLFSDLVRDIPTDALVILDAAALSPYAVSGARKGLDFGTNALTAIILGGITAVGGGVIRDLLLDRVPVILVPGIYLYATAALLGAAVMVAGVHMGRPAARMMLLGGLTCFAVRVLSYFLELGLPDYSI